MSEPSESELDRILAEPVYSGSAYKPFAEMTAAEVEARAAELRNAAGFGRRSAWLPSRPSGRDSPR